MGRQKKSWEKCETFPAPPPCPDLFRTGCCSSIHLSQDPQIGLFAANRHLLLLASSSLALQTPALQGGFAELLPLLPAEPQFADNSSRKNRKSPGVWPISTSHTSVSPFPQRVGRRKRWRVHLLSGVLLHQQHLLFPAKVSAALSTPMGKKLPFPSANGQIIFVSFYWEQPQILTFLAETLSLCLHFLLTDSSTWV